MDDRDAIAALVVDLHWQIDQLRPARHQGRCRNAYNPSYYKRGQQAAMDRGGLAVADYVRRYLFKPPATGTESSRTRTLSIWHARRWLPTQPSRMHICSAMPSGSQHGRGSLTTSPRSNGAKGERERRIARRQLDLPRQIEELHRLSAGTVHDEEAIAVNSAILERDVGDVVALNRLERACAAIGKTDEAIKTFLKLLDIDLTNRIADRQLHELEREHP